MDFPFGIRCSNTGGSRIYTASSSMEFKNAVLMSILFIFKFNLMARDNNTIRVDRWDTGACVRS